MKYSQILSTILLTSSASAHSWVEQLNLIAPNGTMIGTPGFPRGNVLRTSPAFSDTQMTHLLPPNGRRGANPNAILPTDRICKTSQAIGNQTTDSPALIASPGDMVALRYQENGHVTLPATQIGKPANRGTVYVYGTTKPSNSDTLLAIHKVWNEAGTGGNGAGVLLATRNYDDGQCYQANSGALSIQRQAEFPHTATEPMGVNIWCQTDITIPVTAPTFGLYSVYWVWEWPTAAGTAGYPNGKNETYTTCMDISMSASKTSISTTDEKVSFKTGQDLNNAAVADQLTNAFLVAVPTPSSTKKASMDASQIASIASKMVPAIFHQTGFTTSTLPSSSFLPTPTIQSTFTMQQPVPGIPTPSLTSTSTIHPVEKTIYETTTVYASSSSSPSATAVTSKATPTDNLNIQPFTTGSAEHGFTVTLKRRAAVTFRGRVFEH